MVRACVRACVRWCVRAMVRACVRACVRARARVCVCVCVCVPEIVTINNIYEMVTVLSVRQAVTTDGFVLYFQVHGTTWNHSSVQDHHGTTDTQDRSEVPFVHTA